MSQLFGGDHTVFKLAVLKLYGEAYAAVMKHVPGLQGIYIDAFAGDGMGMTRDGVEYEGSVSVCLNFNPPFSHLHFIEIDKSNIERLKNIKASSEQDIAVHHGDANEILPDIVRSIDWKNKRGLVFVDQFGLQLDWSTLEVAFKAGLIDVWILFPVHGIRRQFARSPNNITPEATNRLNHFFGSKRWSEAYEAAPDKFGVERAELDSNVKSKITSIYLKQLQEIASYVAEPIKLYDRKSVHQFSLIFAMSNKSKKAIGLAQKLVSETRQRVNKQFSSGL